VDRGEDDVRSLALELLERAAHALFGKEPREPADLLRLLH